MISAFWGPLGTLICGFEYAKICFKKKQEILGNVLETELFKYLIPEFVLIISEPMNLGHLHFGKLRGRCFVFETLLFENFDF